MNGYEIRLLQYRRDIINHLHELERSRIEKNPTSTKQFDELYYILYRITNELKNMEVVIIE